MEPSVSLSFIGPRNVGPLAFDQVEKYEALAKVGIGLDPRRVKQMQVGMGFDSIQGLSLTSGANNAPIQFLQTWLPGWVTVVTQAMKIDEILGVQTVGQWSDSQIVQGILELTGKAQPYGDYNNIPLSSFNQNYETRSVVRFEEGLRVGVLEEDRMGRVNLDTAGQKREAAALALNIARNAIGFAGFLNGVNKTYGLLNDPNLPAYVTVATKTAGGTSWSVATYLEIVADLRTMLEKLRVQSGDTIDPFQDAITIVLPTASIGFLTVVSQYYSLSPYQWLMATYKNVRIISAPEFTGANGGANIMYAFAETTRGSSTDDSRTFSQLVPVKFKVIGVERGAKAYVEDYSNASAGVLLKRPYAVVRYTGI